MARDIRTLALVGALLCATVLALYAPLAHHDFVAYDDPAYVTQNPAVLRGLTLEGLGWALRAAHSSNWHPLTWLSHMLDVELFGLDAGKHHLVSLGWHAANAVLLFAALRALRAGTGVALFSAFAFAVHPLRVESVAWIAERKDLLAGCAWMVCLLLYARHARCPSRARMLAVALALALGLCAKPMLVSLPLVLLLLDRWPLARREPWGALLREKLPLLVPVLASCALTLWAQSASGALRGLDRLPLDARLSNAFVATVTYAVQTVWPHDLAVFHPHPALVAGGAWQPWNASALAAAALVLGTSVAAVGWRARAPWLFTGWFWFLAALAPVVGIVQVGEQAWAERYAYLPTIGLLLAGACAARALAGRLLPAERARVTLLGLCALLVLGAWAGVARAQVRVWRDTETLFTHAVRRTQGSYTAHLNLGLELSRQGRLDEALAQYAAALAARPGDRWALYDAALVHLRRGDAPQAAECLQAALAGAPQFAAAHGLLGVARGRLGDLRGARRSFEEALALEPQDAVTHGNLGALLAGLGEPLEAERHLRRSLALDPTLASSAERLARLLVTSAGHGPTAVEEARALAREAVRGARSAATLSTLAATLAAGGDFEGALRVQAEALSRAAAGERPRLEAERLRYEQGLPPARSSAPSAPSGEGPR